MDQDRLETGAAEKQFIPGIYNYCDRWCERCPQTSRCMNFSLSEKEFSDPETQDIRNEAFWRKLAEILSGTLELLKETGKKWGIDLDTLDSGSDTESLRANEEAMENHVVCRAAKSYSKIVEDWFREKERLFLAASVVGGERVDLNEAFEVIRWYQYFIAAKVMRAIRGKMEEEEEEGLDEFASDADGSAKITLIAIDRSIAAWTVVSNYNYLDKQKVLEIISYLDLLRQAIEETFPKARSFLRPGFGGIDLNG